MDDDELQSNAQSVNIESDDEFDMNSEEDNNSDSLNIDEVISLLDFVCLCTCVYNMILVWDLKALLLLLLLLSFYNVNSSNDDIDPAIAVQAFMHLKGAVFGVCSKTFMTELCIFLYLFVLLPSLCHSYRSRTSVYLSFSHINLFCSYSPVVKLLESVHATMFFMN